MVCEYKHQSVKCPTCLAEMLPRNRREHQQQCPSVVMESENDSLQEQFQRYRAAAQSEIQELRQELRKIQGNDIYSLISIADDLFSFCILR